MRNVSELKETKQLVMMNCRITCLAIKTNLLTADAELSDKLRCSLYYVSVAISALVVASKH